jgi:uncharacterized membrane protein YdjX (TVP38/TMEM64 family)
LLPLEAWSEALERWLAGRGIWGALLFAAMFIVATLVMFPTPVLTVIGGFAFGFWALPLVALSATIGATLAFLASRYLLRSRVEALINRHPRFTAADRAIGADGWKLVLLLRLSHAGPFNAQNYCLGVTEVRLVHYVVATLVGILPGILPYVALGAAGNAAAGGSVLKWVFFSIGVAVTVIAAYIVARRTRAMLDGKGIGAA